MEVICDSRHPEHTAKPLGALLVYGAPRYGVCHFVLVKGNGRDHETTWRTVECIGDWPSDPSLVVAWEHLLTVVREASQEQLFNFDI